MEFGRVDEQELESIEIRFPEILQLAKPTEKVRLHLGLPLWGSDHLKGTLYPKSTKKADYLSAYADVLDVLELNTTYHSLHEKELIAHWREITEKNPDFRFFPKLPRIISHEGRLDHHFELLLKFTESVKEFRQHLGMCFLQLYPSFTPSRMHELEGVLDLWPSELKLGVEVRHLIWFKNQEARDVLRNLLMRKGVSWVITDTPGIPDVRHQNLTTPEVFIRFVTTGFHAKDAEKMEKWSEQFRQYAQAGVKDIYFFIHERDEWKWRETLEKMVELNADIVTDFLPPLPQDPEQLELL